MPKQKKKTKGLGGGLMQSMKESRAADEKVQNPLSSGAAVGAEFQMVALNSLSPWPGNEKIFPPSRIKELADDIEIVGLQTPLTVVEIEGEDKQYRIVSGERRWRACKLLVERGLTDFSVVEAKVYDSSTDELIIRRIHLTTNTKTRADDPVSVIISRIEDAEVLAADMKDAGLYEPGTKTNEIIADLMDKSSRWVAKYKSFRSLIHPLKDLLDDGKLALEAAADLAKLSEEEQFVELPKIKEAAMSRDKLSKSEVDALVKTDKPGKSISRKSSVVAAAKTRKGLEKMVGNLAVLAANKDSALIDELPAIEAACLKLQQVIDSAKGARG